MIEYIIYSSLIPKYLFQFPRTFHHQWPAGPGAEGRGEVVQLAAIETHRHITSKPGDGRVAEAPRDVALSSLGWKMIPVWWVYHGLPMIRWRFNDP